MGRENLGEFEQLLLMAVLHLEPDAWGTEIRRTLKERSGRNASLGAIYATIRRMSAKGLVEVEDVASPKGGRPRRYVRVTPQGVAAVRRSRESLMAMARGLENRLGAR